MDDIEIYQSAKLYIDQFGDKAAIHKAMRVDELIVEGDVQGVAAWKRIMRAIKEMLTT